VIFGVGSKPNVNDDCPPEGANTRDVVRLLRSDAFVFPRSKSESIRTKMSYRYLNLYTIWLKAYIRWTLTPVGRSYSDCHSWWSLPYFYWYICNLYEVTCDCGQKKSERVHAMPLSPFVPHLSRITHVARCSQLPTVITSWNAVLNCTRGEISYCMCFIGIYQSCNFYMNQIASEKIFHSILSS
jgi:hypothetical protein